MNHRAFVAALATACLLTAMWACGDDPNTDLSGSNGASSSNNSSSAQASSSSSGAVSSTGASSSSGMPFDCDPAAAPGSLYELSDEPLYDPTPLSMCQYRGDVVLIVNTAAI